MNLLSFAMWKSICNRKKKSEVICCRPIAKLFVGLVYLRLTIRYYLTTKKYIRVCLDLIDRALVKTTDDILIFYLFIFFLKTFFFY